MASTPPDQEIAASSVDEHDMAGMIGLLLQVGVLASAVVLLIGGVIYLRQYGPEQVADRSQFVPEPPEYSRPVDIVREALRGRGRPIIQFGLLLLIATPVLRVAFSAVAFARKRDWLYVGITLVVLGVLIYGLLSGQVHG